jgi:hypothetical protein
MSTESTDRLMPAHVAVCEPLKCRNIIHERRVRVECQLPMPQLKMSWFLGLATWR